MSTTTIQVTSGTNTIPVTSGTNTIRVVASGPQGPPGPAGADGGSADALSLSGSWGAGAQGLFVPGAQMIGTGDALLTSGRFYGQYMVCETETTLTEASVEVDTAGGASAILRFAICTFDLTGYDGDENHITWTTLHDLGTVDASSTGTKTIDLSGDPIVLQPGFYGVLTMVDPDGGTVGLSYDRVVYTRPIPGTMSHTSTNNRNYSQPRNTSDSASEAVAGAPTSTVMEGAAVMGGGTGSLTAWLLFKGYEAIVQGVTT